MAYFDDLSSLAGRTIEKKLREEEEARKRLEQQYREFVSREVKKPTVPAIVPKEQPTVTSTRLQDIYTSGMRPVQQQPTPTRLPAIDPDFAARNPIFASALQQRAKTTRLSDIYGDIPKTPVVPIKEAIGVQRDIARERVTDPALEAFIRRTKPEHIETLERLRRVVQPKPANELAGSVIAGFGDVLSFLGGAAQRVAPEKSALERLGREMTQRGEATAERYGRPSTAADKPLYKAVFDPKFWTRDIARAVPTTLSFIPAMLIGYFTGSAAGGAAGLGAFGRAVLGSLGATTLSRPLESVVEAGSVYNQVLSKTGDERQAERAFNEVFSKNLTLGIFDIGELTAAFAPSPVKIGGRLGKAAGAATRISLAGTQEALEEGLQEAFQMQATGEAKGGIIDAARLAVSDEPQIAAARRVGGVFGGALGAAGVATMYWDKIKQKTINRMTRETKERFGSLVKEYEKAGLPEDIAVQRALDKVAQTEQGRKATAEAAIEAAAEIQQSARPGALGGIPTVEVSPLVVRPPERVAMAPERVRPIIDIGRPAPTEKTIVEQIPQERRRDLALRAEVEKLSPEEKDEVIRDLRERVFTDELTGLRNRAAYMVDEKRPYQAIIDLDNLKWVNDNIGHSAGDSLIRTFAATLPRDSYRISGDEFVIQGDTREELEALLSNIESRLSGQTLELKGDRRTVTKKGIEFSYGVGETLDRAETALQKHKTARLKEGKRAARGEQPPGIAVEKPAAKEPWEMTEKEFLKWYRPKRHFQRYTPEQRADIAASTRTTHRQKEAVGEYFYTNEYSPDIAFKTAKEAKLDAREKIIQRALLEGKPVPPEVLKDYPDLARKTKTETKSELKKPAAETKEETIKSIIEKLDEMQDVDRYNPDKVRLLQQLGEKTTGVRLGDAEETGLLRYMLEKGEITQEQWDKHVKSLVEEGRIKDKSVLGGKYFKKADKAEKETQQVRFGKEATAKTERGTEVKTRFAVVDMEQKPEPSRTIQKGQEAVSLKEPPVTKEKTSGKIKTEKPAGGMVSETQEIGIATNSGSDIGGAVEAARRMEEERASETSEGIINPRAHIRPAVSPENVVEKYSEFKGKLMPHQIEGVNMALAALKRKGGFLLADGAGAGKTRQGLAVAYIRQKQGAKRILILTERDSVINDAWMKEAERIFGKNHPLKKWKPGDKGDGIYIATYSKLRTKDPVPIDNWDVVILDECHNLKNIYESQQAKKGLQLINKTPEVMFVSATPYDRLQEFYYLGKKIGEFTTRKEFERWLEGHGVGVKKREVRTPRGIVTVNEYYRKVPPDELISNIQKLGDKLTASGLMLKREVSMDGLNIEIKNVELSKEAYTTLDAIRRHFSGQTGLDNAHMFLAMRRHLENHKVDAAVEIAKEELAKGKQVVIFTGYKEGAEVKAESGEVLVSSEPPIKALREKLEAIVGKGNVAEIHGGLAGEEAPEVKKEIEAYQSGKKKVAIATMDMGSTGISLHDETGERPRTQIMLTLPWSALKHVQTAGRSHRLTSKSNTQLVVLTTDTEIDQRLTEVLSAKLKSLGAMVGGDIGKLDLVRGEAYAEVDDATIKDILLNPTDAVAVSAKEVKYPSVTTSRLEAELREITGNNIEAKIEKEDDLISLSIKVGEGYQTVLNKWGKEDTKPGTIKIFPTKESLLSAKYVASRTAFEDKDKVKEIGAVWGPSVGAKKNWYIPIDRIPDVFKKFKHGEITSEAVKEYESLFGNTVELKQVTEKTPLEGIGRKKTLAEVEEELKAEVEKTTKDVGTALRFAQIPPIKPPKSPKEKGFTFENPDIEARYRAAHGVPKRTVQERVAEFVKTLFRKATREYEHLPRGAKYAELRFALTKLKKQKGVASDKTLRIQQGITAGIDGEKYNLFERKVLLDDLFEEAKQGHSLPFGFTKETLEKELKRIDAMLDDNVKAAVERRRSLWEALTDEYTKSMKAIGFDVSKRLTRKNYFRHQVLEYANAKGLTGTGKKLKTPTGRGFLKRREGSTMDINTNYLEAEYEVMAQMSYDIEVAKTIKKIEDGYSITKKVKQEYITKLEELMEGLGFTKEQLLSDMKKNNIPKVAYENTLRSKIRELDPEALKKANLEDWHVLIPEGYTVWQPREGNVFFMGETVPEKLVRELTEKGLTKITERDIKKALIVGGKRREFVIPEEVALTLDDMVKDRPQSFLASTSAQIMRKWKVWVLISPRRWFKYNFRNISGDAEGAFVGNPSGFKKVPQAIQDLYPVFVGDKSMTKEMQEWFERGGIQTLLQAQELGDINHLRMFIKKVKAEQRGKLHEIPVKIWQKYWKAARMSTDFREAVLRYANYLDYLEQMTKGGGKPRNFGASIPEEVMALKDIRDRAFKLSNDLLGAYDEVSVFGQELRQHLIPFWSWKEVNFRRYTRLIKNAFYTKDREMMVRIGKAMGAKTPVVAFRVGKFLVMATAFSAMLEVYNHILFPDLVDKVPKYVKERPHIILGEDEYGNVRYFTGLGALGDFLEWFGLDSAPMMTREWLNGKKTLNEIAKDMAKKPVNIVAQGLRPEIATFLEVAGGVSIFPDVFEPKRVRDKWYQLFKNFNLEHEYSAITGKPMRGGYSKSLEEALIYKSDIGEVAYNNIRSAKYDFMKKIGKSTGYSDTNPKLNALYYLKLALRYRDREAAEKYLLEYIHHGGTQKGLKQSIKMMHPLSGLSKEEKQVFIKSLTQEEKSDLIRAVEYYEEVFLVKPKAKGK